MDPEDPILFVSHLSGEGTALRRLVRPRLERRHCSSSEQPEWCLVGTDQWLGDEVVVSLSAVVWMSDPASRVSAPAPAAGAG